MGKYRMKHRFFLLLLLSSVLSGLCLNQQLSAQEIKGKQLNDQGQLSKKRWQDWLGFQVLVSAHNVGVLTNAVGGNSQNEFATPQLGGRVQIGVILDKQTDNVFILSVGFGKAKNLDKGTKEQFVATSFLDIGLEYPTWSIINRDNHRLSFDIGAFASMCSVQIPNSKSLNRWGLAGRLSLGYSYKLNNGLTIGCKLYDHMGWYFSKLPADAAFHYPLSNELGLAFVLSI